MLRYDMKKRMTGELLEQFKIRFSINYNIDKVFINCFGIGFRGGTRS